jgi:hypothetical protein
MGSCEKPKYNILGTSRRTCGAKLLDIDKGRWDEGPTFLYALKHLGLQEATRGYLGLPPYTPLTREFSVRTRLCTSPQATFILRMLRLAWGC